MNLLLFASLAALIQSCRGLVYPETTYECPTMDNISGHIQKINDLSHIPNSTFYLSGDAIGRIIVGDIRNGQAVQIIDSFTADTAGILQIVPFNSENFLAISQTDTKVYNMFKKEFVINQAITTDSKKSQQNAMAKLVSLTDQQGAATQSQIYIIYVDQTLGLTKVSRLNLDFTFQQIFQITLSQTIAPPPPGKSNQPLTFIIAENISGVMGNSNPIHILIGVSAINQLYACKVSNINTNIMQDGGYWNPTIIDYVVMQFAYLTGTQYVAIQLGQAVKAATTYQYSLLFLDLTTLLTDGSPSVFNANQMLSTPVATINLGSATNLMTLIQCIQYQNDNYVVFVQNSKQIIIFKISDFIAGGFKLNNAVKITFTNIINQIEYVNIPNISRLIVGFSQGNVFSFDYINYISSTTTVPQNPTITPTYSFQQTSLGLSANVVGYNFDSTNSILSVLGAPQNKLGVTTFDYSQINLTTKLVTNTQTFTVNNSITLYNIIIKPQVIFSVNLGKAINYEPRLSNNSCPTTIVAATLIAVNFFSISINNLGSNINVTIDLSSTNQGLMEYLGQSKFVLNNVDYVAVILTTRSFVVSHYCVVNPTGNPPPLGQSIPGQSSVHILVYNLAGQKVFQTTTSLLTSDNPTQQFISSSVDNQQNISVLFKDFITIVKFYLVNSVMNIQTSTYRSVDVYNQAIAISKKITSSTISLLSFFYISSLSKIFIQYTIGVPDGKTIYSSFFAYNQNWTTDVALQMQSLMVSNQGNNNSPTQITQLQYIDDFQLVVSYNDIGIQTYKLDLTSILLTLTNTIHDTKIALDSSYIINYKNQNNNYILKLEAAQTIQMINLKSCFANVCNTMACNQEYDVKQLSGSVFSDIFTSSAGGELTRVELLDISILKLNDFKRLFLSISINYNINFEKGSNIVWRNRYATITTISGEIQYFLTNQINLKIQSMDSSLANPQDTTEVFYLSSSESLNLLLYTYISLNNIDWIMTFQQSIISQDNSYYIIDNVLLHKNSNLMIQKYITVAGDGMCVELEMKNIKYESQVFIDIQAFIFAEASVFTITLQNITFEKSTFVNSNLIFSDRPLIINGNDITLNQNIIITNDTQVSLSNNFITSQNTTFLNFNCNQNTFENTILFGNSFNHFNISFQIVLNQILNSIHTIPFYSKQNNNLNQIGLNSYTSSINWSLENFNMLSTLILTTNPVISVLIFDAQASTIGDTLSTFTMKSSSIKQNSQKFCEYYQLQINNCTQSSSSTGIINAISQGVQYYQLGLDFVQITTIDDFQDVDNQQTLLQLTKGSQLLISTYTCSNTIASKTIVDVSCLLIKDHSNIDFSITQAYFINKNIQNSYLIQISSDSQSLNSNQSDGKINIDNIQFNNIAVSTLSSFYKSSSLYIQSLQKLVITLTSVTFDGIQFTSPEILFQNQGSCIFADAPFSSFTAQSSSFLNIQTYSPAAAVYTNVKQITLNKCTFKNNNFNLANVIYQGGFLQVQSNNFISKSTNFTEGISNQGTGITLIPSIAKAIYKFEDCLFENLIALSQGAAIYINQALNSTELGFTRCTFSNLAADKGAGLWIYFAVQQKQKSIYYQLFPLVTFESCTSNNLYATQGGLIYSTNSQIILNIYDSSQNNINDSQHINNKVLNFAQELDAIGEFISLDSSFLTATQLTVKDHSSSSQNTNTGVSNIVFLNAYTKSSVNLISSSIDSCKFSSSGFILIDSSRFAMKDTNITNIQYSSRILQTNINIESQSKFSPIIVKSTSTIDFVNVRMQKMVCSDIYCSGGAIILISSGGIIDSSYFEDNQSYSNGGSISILNLSAPLLISNTYILRSISSNAKGGGLSFISDQIDNELILQNSFVNNNNAQLGGAINFELQTKPVKFVFTIDNTSVSQNSAQQLGGGIFYQGYAPNILNPSLISQNTAQSSFGQNSFSYPKKLILNEQLSKIQDGVSFSKYTNNLGETVYKVTNQVSGIALPNLIFQLVDENGSILDKQYIQIANIVVSLSVNKETALSHSKFTISSSISDYQFTDYFNVTNLILTGIPGTTVFLTLTSNSIVTNSQAAYRLLLEIDLRNCLRGEIFTKQIETSITSITTYYKCDKCLQGTYSLEYPNLAKPVEECKKCNSNAFCPGGDLLELNSGYWRINDQTDEILSCINAPENCLGGSSNSTCTLAHKGPLCESCDIQNNYTTSGNFQCGSCGDHFQNSLKIIGLMIFYIISAKISVDGILQRLLSMYSIRSRLNEKQLQLTEDNASILLKLILNYFQIIMVLTTFQISIPTGFNAPVDVIANPTTQILYSFECFFYQLSLKSGINMIYIQLISSIILPIVCLLIFFVSGVIKFRKDPYQRSFYLYTSSLYCLMYFQPSIFKNAISVIKCRKIGQQEYIQYNVLFSCHTSQYNTWSVGLIIPVILVVSFLIPLILAIVIYKSKDNLIAKKKYTFMTGEYYPQTWFWEFIKMYMKLLIMCCLIFYEYDIPNKILFIFFIISFYGFLLFYFKPYKLEIYNKVDILQTTIQGVSVYLAFVAFQNLNNAFWWILALLIIAFINTVFIVWSFKLLTQSYMIKARSSIENIKLYFAKFLCCRKYFFTNKSRKYYSRKRWLRSIIEDMKKRNLVNHWTGKIRIDKDQVFPVLQGKILDMESVRIKSQTRAQNINICELTVSKEQVKLQNNLYQKDTDGINFVSTLKNISQSESNTPNIMKKLQKKTTDSNFAKFNQEDNKDTQSPKLVSYEQLNLDTPKQSAIQLQQQNHVISPINSPNTSQRTIFSQRDDLMSNDYYPEFQNLDECVQVQSDDKYMHQLQPKLEHLNKILRNRKQSDLVEMISSVYDSSNQIGQKIIESNK